MRVLIIHNRYQDPGGEDTVVQQESELLAGTEDVQLLSFANEKGIKGVLQTLLYPWNLIAASRLKLAIRDFKPDIIHLHNFHYAAGPLVIRVAKKFNIPLVMTVHNYRLVCPSATLFHNGKLFTESIGSPFPWVAVWRGVHSHSVIKTFWFAWWNWFHRKIGTWRQVAQYIVLTDFAKQILLDSKLGLSERDISVKQNFAATTPRIAGKRREHFLFIGRLSMEKGISVLLDVFKDSDKSIKIGGDGPLREAFLGTAALYGNISYLGSLTREEVNMALSECTALIFPSIWYEGMPMTIIEAFAQGTPVIASNLGAMKYMIKDGENGLLFDPNNAVDLAEKIGQWSKKGLREKQFFGESARATYEKYYTAETNKTLLLGIYTRVLSLC